MASDVQITIEAEWRDIEPEGTKCYACGDMCLLREVSLFVTVNGDDGDPIVSLCGSCADARGE